MAVGRKVHKKGPGKFGGEKITFNSLSEDQRTELCRKIEHSIGKYENVEEFSMWDGFLEVMIRLPKKKTVVEQTFKNTTEDGDSSSDEVQFSDEEENELQDKKGTVVVKTEEEMLEEIKKMREHRSYFNKVLCLFT
eukprot:UN34875